MLASLLRLVLLGAAVLVIADMHPAASSPVPDMRRISEIRVEGTQRLEPEAVRSYFGIRAGELASNDQINAALKRLFATGLFADVQIGRSGSVLTVTVTENPTVDRIALEGNHHLDDQQLLDELQLRPGQVYTRTKLQSDTERLLGLYRRQGRFAARIEPKLIERPQNRVDLAFEIHEGARTGIKRISFVGNHRFSADVLRASLESVETRWWRFFTQRDSYDPDRFAVDRERLRRFYQDAGFADATVSSAVAELEPRGDAFDLTFTINEGEPYRFGPIDLTTNLTTLDVPALRRGLRTQEGDGYDAQKVDDSVRQLTDALGSLGYAFAEVEPVVKRDPASRKIGLTYELREGPKTFVDRIEVVGNVRTLDKVIRREISLAEGDAVDTAKLRQSIQRLRNLGFFKSVEVKLLPASGSGAPARLIDRNP